MDHSHMDHGHMGHDMPGMDHGAKCSMNVRSSHYSPSTLHLVRHPIPPAPSPISLLHPAPDADLHPQMLFTWDTTDLCIVFRGWRITGTGSLIVSLLAIILLTAGYEAVREASRRYEAYAAGVESRRDGVGRGEFGYVSYI
jgi:copper transporter 1